MTLLLLMFCLTLGLYATCDWQNPVACQNIIVSYMDNKMIPQNATDMPSTSSGLVVTMLLQLAVSLGIGIIVEGYSDLTME